MMNRSFTLAMIAAMAMGTNIKSMPLKAMTDAEIVFAELNTKATEEIKPLKVEEEGVISAADDAVETSGEG